MTLTARTRNPNVDSDMRRFYRWASMNCSQPIARPYVRTCCWIWVGARTTKKKPVFRVAGKTVSAAAWYWKRTTGLDVPAGFQLSPRCRVSYCIRPDHRELRPRGSHLRKSQ